MKKYLGLLLLFLFLIPFSGCGESVSAPPGAKVKINPSEVTITDTGAIDTHTQFFSISVTDANDIPLGNIKITISYPWAVPDSSGVVQLYNGSTPVNSPFDTETDDFGIYNLRMDYQSGGLDYKGDLEVRSGTAYGKASFEVKSE
ncbi:MAG: hypothetical protein FJ241_07045 [Nitrospira sp.]|nr:hypothetical protein [Nitrospira sp.]